MTRQEDRKTGRDWIRIQLGQARAPVLRCFELEDALLFTLPARKEDLCFRPFRS